MADLTPDEIAFFETGELPAALQAEVTPPVVEPVVAPVTPPATPNIDTMPNAEEMLRRSLAEEQTRRATMEAELINLRRQFEEKTNPPPQAPDGATDPLGLLVFQQQALARQMQDLQTRLTTETQNATLKQQFEQFTSSIRAIKDAYEKTVPDFNDAYMHVRNTRAEDLRMAGMPEASINQTLLQDELNIAQNALTNGKNPAEEIYKMAKRYGYAPKAANTQTPQDKINAILAGQAAAKNPGAGSPPAAEITTEGLKDMSSNDLTKLVMDDKAWDRLVGGKSTDIF